MEGVVAFTQQLKSQVAGSVIVPGDADYDSARRAWNLTYDQHPAVIIAAENAQDVIAGVRFARDAGLGVSIMSTGHGLQQLADDNLLIVTTRMNGVTVDADAQTARVESGAKWRHVVEAAAPHGLAPLLGSSPYVGVVGYSLGGGIGWLARKYGLAADSIRWIDVVTPDGELRRASPDENSDLFWGLRGGGGNFGVVTALEFSLYPVATLYGGFVVYPGDAAADALRFYRDWVSTLPDELTSSIQIMNFPDLPFLPEQIRGKTQVFVRAAYAGDAAEGERFIQQWLDWRAPLANTFREMPFSEVGTISNDPVDPGAGYGANELLNTLSDDAIEIIARHATNKQSPLALAEIRHAGGAISRVAPDASAIGNRDAQFYFQLGGPLFAPDAKKAVVAAIGQVKADLQPYFSGGVYLNFNAAGAANGRTQDAYGADNYQRLLALKAKYDPQNVFRFGYQLTPPENAQA